MLIRFDVATLLVLCTLIGCPSLLRAQNLELRATLQNPAPGNLGFGYSVAAHGDTVAIGAPLLHQNGIQRGAVAIYSRAGGTWTLQQTLTRPEGVGFGGTVAVSGDTLITGRLGFSGGGGSNIYVYVRNAGTWTLQGELVSSGGAATANRIVMDGDTALVAYSTGGVYVFVRSGTSWFQQQRLRPEDPPGQQPGAGAIDLGGDTAIVGAPRETVGANANQGAAYVFVRSGSTWTQQARLLSSAGRQNGFFGNVLSLSGNDVVIGPGGGGSLFSRVGTTWVPQPSFDVPPASHPASPDMQLRNVVLNLDTAVVSFSEGGLSAIKSWVYKRVAGHWIRLEPATVVLGNVALSGNALISGFAYYGSDPNQNPQYYPGPGIAYIYAVADAAPPDPVTLEGEVNGTIAYLNWTLAAGGTAATSYVIEAGTSPGASNFHNGDVGNIRHVYSPPLPAGRYYVRVRPVNAFGVGAPSNEVVLTVGTPPAAVPGAPALTGSVSNNNVIALAWTPSSNGGAPTSYWLEAGSTSGATDLYNGNIGTGTAINATVTAGTYFIRVRGVNAGGAGPASNERVFVATGCSLPLVPTGLHFTRDGDRVTVRWDVTPGAVEYFLLAGTAPNTYNLYNGTVGRFTSITETVGPGTYYVRVRGVSNCGPGTASPELEIKIQ